MKDYAQMKKDKKWSIAKVKVVDAPAVSEVKDDKGVVVREAKAEVSHDVVKLSKKAYDSATGSAIADVVSEVDADKCTSQMEMYDKQIAEATAQKAGWEALKTDVEAL